jgi:hypothetical protein
VQFSEATTMVVAACRIFLQYPRRVSRRHHLQGSRRGALPIMLLPKKHGFGQTALISDLGVARFLLRI